MAYSGVLDDIKKCILLKQPDRVPVFAISDQFDIFNLGITQREWERNFDKMVFVAVESVKKFDYDWVLLHPDDYIELETIVETVQKEDTSIPVIAKKYIPATREYLDKFKIPDFKKELRMPVYLDAIREVKNKLGDNVCVTGRLAAPFSTAALVFGITETMLMIINDRDFLKESLLFFTELQTRWAIEQIKAGVDAIWVGDCVASSNFISPVTFEEFALPGLKEIASTIKQNGCIAYYHAAEKTPGHLNMMPQAGVDIVNIGEGIDIEEAKALIGNEVCISGNLAPIKILANGTKEDVEAAVEAIMKKGKCGGGFIFNTEEGIPYYTPEDNIQAMLKTARKFGTY